MADTVSWIPRFSVRLFVADLVAVTVSVIPRFSVRLFVADLHLGHGA